jgi:hypothetical protein
MQTETSRHSLPLASIHANGKRVIPHNQPLLIYNNAERTETRTVHGVPSGRLLSSVTLDKGQVQGVGERELGDITGRVLLLLVGLESG